MTMYSDAAKTSGNDDNMAVNDIVDFVLEAMDLPEQTMDETFSTDTEEAVSPETLSEELNS